MPIPQEIVFLIARLNQEFDRIERDVFTGLALVRRNLAFFPNNIILTQYFAYLNAVSLAIETYRQQLQAQDRDSIGWRCP